MRSYRYRPPGFSRAEAAEVLQEVKANCHCPAHLVPIAPDTWVVQVDQQVGIWREDWWIQSREQLPIVLEAIRRLAREWEENETS